MGQDDWPSYGWLMVGFMNEMINIYSNEHDALNQTTDSEGLLYVIVGA